MGETLEIVCRVPRDVLPMREQVSKHDLVHLSVDTLLYALQLSTRHALCAPQSPD